MTDILADLEPTRLALAAIAGALLGLLFFGGLWWTVASLATSRRPAVLFLASYLIRLAIALGGIALIAQGSAARAVACLVGFLAVRPAVKHVLGRRDLTPLDDAAES